MRKPQIVACFIGHVDSGKSTTVGHLSLLYNTIDKRQLEKNQKEAESLNKASFALAYVCDTLKAERERGITIKTNLIKLELPDRTVNVMDCPGHKDFIKNMVSGTAQADVAIVIVPCASGEFESAIINGTLKEHILISGVFGVKRLIIAVNKVDMVAEADQPARFKEVVDELKNVVRSIHSDKDPIAIPISGLTNINLNKDSKKLDWWRGWKSTKNPDMEPVFTLEDAINSVEQPVRPTGLPLRAGMNSRIPVHGIGFVYTGQVIQGLLKTGDILRAYPADVDAEVKTLEIHRTSVGEILPGENFGMCLKILDGTEKSLAKTGNVFCHKNQAPLQFYDAYICDMFLLDHPKGITTKYTPSFVVYLGAVPARVAKFIKSINLKTKTVDEDPKIITKGHKFECLVVPNSPIVAEPYKETPTLGRCCLRDGGKIVAVGQVKFGIKKDRYSEYGYVDESAKATTTKAAPAAKAGKKK